MRDYPVNPSLNVTHHLDFAHLTDTGRARSNNEDSVRTEPTLGLAVLADGMGGYNAGEVASDMATRCVAEFMTHWLGQQAGPQSGEQLCAALVGATQQANLQVFEAANSRADYNGMGTTLVTALFVPEQVWVAHVGDSRAYRLRAGQLSQLSRDHSLLQEQIDAGLLTPEEASFSMHRNLVTRAIGVEPQVEVEVHPHDLHDGDVVLLCSDGLSDMLPDVHIAQIMRQHDELGQMAQALIDAANAAGGRDNIAVVLVRVRGALSRSGRGWWPFKR